MSATLKLLICYHKKDVLLKDDILTPIHVGRALARKKLGEDNPDFKWLFENMIGDDTGENISAKNSSYNELTAVYWAWKNYDKLGDPDYIGLMHYRRHFIFRPSIDVVEDVDGIDDNYFKRINYNKETIEHLFDDCDYVAHIGHVDEVYKHYKENHHIEDLDLAISILKDKYPEYATTADAYLKMSYVNLCNMFIMPRNMFFEYCSWLFDILQEFENKVDLSDKRLFISERLTGIFIEHQKRKGLRQKPLSATFIQAPTYVPIAIPYNQGSLNTAVTMASILNNADKKTKLIFYLLCLNERNTSPLDNFVKLYNNCSVQYINVPQKLSERGIYLENLTPDIYPFIVSELLDKESKVIYLNEHVLFGRDIADFYRTCNNDEFDIIALPESMGITRFSLCSLNTRRIRAHINISKICDSEGSKISSILLRQQVKNMGTLAWWLYQIIDYKDCDDIVDTIDLYNRNIDNVKTRHAIIYADNAVPWVNIQLPMSKLWWNTAETIEGDFKFDLTDELLDIFAKQTLVFEAKCTRKDDSNPFVNIIKKTVRYYKQNGLKATLIKIKAKLLKK